MDEPCRCFECEARSELAAYLWTEEWGANARNPTPEDDHALDRILHALERHWIDGDDKSRTVQAVMDEMNGWRKRHALLH